MYLKDKDIEKLIQQKGGCNFAGIAVTPWHAHGIDVAINKLRDKGVDLVGYVLAVTFPTGSRTVFKESFTSLDNNIEIIECSLENKNLIRKTVENIMASINLKKTIEFDNVFYVARPSYPEFNWINIISKTFTKTKVSFISIDEGCGSYMIDNNENWVAAMSEASGNREGFIHSLKINIWKKIANSRIKYRKSMERKLIDNGLLSYWHLLSAVNDGGLTINNDISDRYKNIFLKFNNDSSTKASMYENAVIISMAPSFEEGFNDADLKLLDILIPILNNYSYRIIIKLHPRETDIDRYLHYGVTISHDVNMSQEMLLAKCKTMPKCVISIASTTLITLRSIYGVPSIGLAKLYISAVNDKEKTMSIVNFIKTFENIVEFPNNQEELADLIGEVLGQ